MRSSARRGRWPTPSPATWRSWVRASGSWASCAKNWSPSATPSPSRAGPQIVEGDADVEDEDLIPREEMVVTVTHGGYVKRTALSAYRTQHRGGKGKTGMAMKDEDAVTRIFSASTHAPVLFFSSAGKVYKLKVWKLPNALANARGKAFINLLPLEQGDRITTVLPLPEDEAAWERLDVLFATSSGDVRRNKLSDFVQVNRSGKIAMKLGEGEHILGVQLCTEDQDVLLTTAGGRCIRFAVGDTRVFQSRESTGVRGVRLAAGDEVISMAILRHVEADPTERAAYLRQAAAARAAATGDPNRRGRRTGRSARDRGRRGCRRRRRTAPVGGALHPAGRRRTVHPHRHRQRLRQAHLGLRLSPDRPRRPGPDRPQPRPRRQARRQLPHRGER